MTEHAIDQLNQQDSSGQNLVEDNDCQCNHNFNQNQQDSTGPIGWPAFAGQLMRCGYKRSPADLQNVREKRPRRLLSETQDALKVWLACPKVVEYKKNSTPHKIPSTPQKVPPHPKEFP